jgi:WD40 repeat protein
VTRWPRSAATGSPICGTWLAASPRPSPARQPGVIDVAFGLGGDLLAAASGDGHIYLWDMVSAQAAGSFVVPGSPTVYAVSSGPVGQVLAAACTE